MSQDDTDRWLRVLAGKARPDNEEARKAAVLRALLIRDAEAAVKRDPASTTRIVNLLEAKGAFNAPKPAPVRASNPLAAAWAWLFHAGGGHPGRYAAVAAVALAVLAAPGLLRDAFKSPDDDSGTMKGLPPIVSPGATARETVVVVADPDKDATQLLVVLGRQGVSAQITEDQADRVIQARVPAERLASVNAEMNALGLVLPSDGQLKFRFRKGP